MIQKDSFRVKLFGYKGIFDIVSSDLGLILHNLRSSAKWLLVRQKNLPNGGCDVDVVYTIYDEFNKCKHG